MKIEYTPILKIMRKSAIMKSLLAVLADLWSKGKSYLASIDNDSLK